MQGNLDRAVFKWEASDEILEYASEADFPITGDISVLYVALDINIMFRWTSTVYVNVGTADEWGQITGDITQQVDLKNALAATTYDDTSIQLAVSANTDKVTNVDHPLVQTAVPVGAVFTDTVYTHPASHPATFITQDTSHRFITDAERVVWNDKEDDLGNPAVDDYVLVSTALGVRSWRSDIDTSVTVNNTLISTSTIEALSAAQGKVLKDVQDTQQTAINLNTAKVTNVDHPLVETSVPVEAVFTDTIYSHPANHLPSIITQDISNRFVTDTEKGTWNGKQDPATTLVGYGITDAAPSSHVSTHPAPTFRDTRNQIAGTYATGTGTASGTNTGDQTTISGNAGTATILQTARTINGVSFNGSANIVIPSDTGIIEW